jgi:uncharacterized protein (TIGR03118 family)
MSRHIRGNTAPAAMAWRNESASWRAPLSDRGEARSGVRKRTRMRFRVAILAFIAPTLFGANSYVQHNLVSDLPGMADQTDANLVNPWGLATSSISPFWVGNNHSGISTVYNTAGRPFPLATPLVVAVPLPPAARTSSNPPPAAPTGITFNDTPGFNVAAGKPALFLFAAEDGTVSGWNAGVDPANAILLVDNSASGAVYKGLAAANTDSGPMLYATNFNSGAIDVFDANFAPVAAQGGFTDPALPAGFAPFNIQRIGRKLYVTYAMQNDQRHDDVAGIGNGFVDTFDFNGNLLGRLISNGNLNSPWGLALAPENFGDFSHALLVGNFGDGTINAYDPCSGAYLGTLNDVNGQAVSILGLWALRFGNGHNGGDANTLYFTAGIPGSGAVEDHGLFGGIQTADSVPPPNMPSSAINVSNFAFTPTPVTVAAGTQVIWTNQDSVVHTIVADDNRFGSPVLDNQQTFSQTLTAPGTYSYHCSIHPFMKGKIIVQ